MAKRTKKDSKPKEETPEVLTSAEVEPKAEEPKEAPAPEPVAPKKEPATPEPRPEQQMAAAYLKELGAKPAEPPKPREDHRAGKRPPPPNQPEPKLSARQFVRARKQRWERCAGFLLEMKLKLGPNARLTMIEWQPLWDAFWTRPVGGCRR